MEVPDSHIRVNVISTVTNAGVVRFMTYWESMTGALFIVFLSRLIRGAKRKVFLIVDQLGAPGSAEVREWVSAHPDQIELFELPTHSPELNVNEYLNNDLKGSVNAEGLPASEEGLPPFYVPGAVRVGSIVTDGSSGRRSAAESARGAIAPNSAGVRYPSEL